MQSRTSSSAKSVEPLEARKLFSGTAALVTQTNLVTSGNAGSLPALHTDPLLVNPWGIAAGPGGPFWIADNNSGVATLYDGTGVSQTMPFNIPPATGSASSNPTGQVFAGGLGFVPDPARPSDTAVFIFDGEDGGITAWSPAFGHDSFLAVDHGNADPTQNAVYKGLAVADVGNAPFLYATNFRSGAVEVYNTHFQQVSSPGGFTDRRIPRGFAPFGIQAIGNNLFVTYARQNAAKHDDVAGAGNGFVDEFDTRGVLVRRFHHGQFLNSPWGVSRVPNDRTFGGLRNDILVGNFGSGAIDVFSPGGQFRGTLDDAATGRQTIIEGLWGLSFGNGSNNAPSDTLFFTAGSNDEQAGLFGSLTFTAPRKHPHKTTAGAGNHHVSTQNTVGGTGFPGVPQYG